MYNYYEEFKRMRIKMMEWVLKFLSYIWNNLSNIDSLINIIMSILGICAFSGSLIAGFLRLKLKHNRYKCLNIPIDNVTKKSMKYYVPTRGQKRDPCTEDENIRCFSIDLTSYFVKQVFENSNEQYYIVLADSGMGKTTFLLHLFFQYYKKIRKKYNIVLVSLAFESSTEIIRKIENKSKTILLLDGFDEDTHAINDYINRMNVICDETELFYKIIITCRTQFFPDRDSEPKYTGKIKFGIGNKSVEFIKYYISPFNEKEVNLYLKKKYNYLFERKKIERSQKIISNCPYLMVRPMLLSYIDDLLLDKTVKYEYTYEIYKELVLKWIQRETVKNELLYEFSEKVAEYMFLKRSVYIESDKIQELCKKYNIAIRSFEARSRSLLNRNADGMYKFAHKSILEYFLAKKSFQDFEFRKNITLCNFNGYDMAKTFLQEMSIVYLKKVLHKNNNTLKGVSFQYLQLPSAVFRNVQLIDCDFEGCNLSQAEFLQTRFTTVNFDKANLEKAVFHEVVVTGGSFKGANLYKADLRNIESHGSDFREANLRITRLNNAKLVKANLEYADLGNADLEFADLNGANLNGANLKGTELLGSNIMKASSMGKA